MSESSENEQGQPDVQFVISGPDGPVNPQDLNVKERENLLRMLEESGVPQIVLDQVKKDFAEIPAADDNDPSAPEDNGSLLCCRTHLWQTLDELFPNSPHLWSAAEALMSISRVLNPSEPDDPMRQLVAQGMLRTALEQTRAHIDAELNLLDNGEGFGD